jgi:uncharacterized protein (DUF427 family)
MIRAVWNGTVVAEAPQTVRVEGNLSTEFAATGSDCSR